MLIKTVLSKKKLNRKCTYLRKLTVRIIYVQRRGDPTLRFYLCIDQIRKKGTKYMKLLSLYIYFKC